MSYPTSLNVLPTTPPVLHRSITGLDGLYAPAVNHADWDACPVVLNEREAPVTRFYLDIAVAGATGLADEPQITLRPYVRNASIVAAGLPTQVTRPRLQNAPTIKFQKTVNNGVAYTDYSANVIDNNPATQADLDALDTVANGDWFVVGGPSPFVGVALDMDAANVNGNASVLTAEYWNGAAWVAVTGLVDGTIAAPGMTLSGDGQISWNLPVAGWAQSTINGITAYWIRFSVSLALSANVDVEECDLLQPFRFFVDFNAYQEDVIMFLESQDAVVTGTLVYSGSIYVTWR